VPAAITSAWAVVARKGNAAAARTATSFFRDTDVDLMNKK